MAGDRPFPACPGTAAFRSALKILAIDYGQVRTGLAASDADVRLAYPLLTLDFGDFPDRKAFLARLADIVREQDAREVVIGLPLLEDGSDSLTTRQVRNFARRLSHRVSCPCLFVNELLSSVEAERDLREAGVARNRRGAVLDQQAAVRILETYLRSPRCAVPVEDPRFRLEQSD